jgi:hypothetical protein
VIVVDLLAFATTKVNCLLGVLLDDFNDGEAVDAEQVFIGRVFWQHKQHGILGEPSALLLQALVGGHVML